ncbi:hypothetical protein [Geothrix sp. 21YS21S-4]|uniref:hypothetical protein n=1 Tax=Geothrix sp. 21YS21S-4 TaxID=3068889 RepID=UPI0027B8AD8D|nr:hypothetical protein [Geothrix sp. 21YS21S-4]
MEIEEADNIHSSKKISKFLIIYINIYIYIVWFVYRNFKSSFKSMEKISLIQAAAAPGLPLACYLMSLYFVLELIIGIHFPTVVALMFLFGFIFITLMILWLSPGLSDIKRRFLDFELLPSSKRKRLDMVVWCILILAIPVALFSALAVRNRFILQRVDRK